jgi:hypothetical protein
LSKHVEHEIVYGTYVLISYTYITNMKKYQQHGQSYIYKKENHIYDDDQIDIFMDHYLHGRSYIYKTKTYL